MKGLGKQEGGAQTSTNTSTQSSSPTQDVRVTPEAIAKAAGDLLATVAPGSDAAKLAQAAIDAAKSRDVAKAQDLLTQAKAAVHATPTSGVASPSSPTSVPTSPTK